MKSTETSRWQLLKLGVTVPIKPGDICSLVSEKCWFKVVSEPSMMEINEENTEKRKANENISCDVPHKKLCSESGEGDNLGCINIPNDVLVDNNNIPTAKTQEPVKTEANLSSNAESAEANIQKTQVFSSNDENRNSTNGTEQSDKPLIAESTESHDSVEANKPNVSDNVPTDTPIRERCKYGDKCYRRNPQHKAKYSHPMDSDYDTIDNRKECPYGIQCYRTNPQHKKDYKHTMQKAPNDKRKRASKKTSLASSNTLSDLEDSFSDDSVEESVDESDYQPSSDVENSDDDEYDDKSEMEWEDDTTDD
ncbi:uncharacterized protein LOC116423907 isoform X2 [Nomia melanderi]|nr:aprataxin and PNK-like factor isoform X2 [Nomia melanderi]